MLATMPFQFENAFLARFACVVFKLIPLFSQGNGMREMTIQPSSSNASIRESPRGLKTGSPAAHPQICLMLLGSPPDMIRRGELRRTHFSTALRECGDTNIALRLAYHPCWSGLQVQGTANSPDSMAIFHIPFLEIVYHTFRVFARVF